MATASLYKSVFLMTDDIIDPSMVVMFGLHKINPRLEISIYSPYRFKDLNVNPFVQTFNTLRNQFRIMDLQFNGLDSDLHETIQPYLNQFKWISSWIEPDVMYGFDNIKTFQFESLEFEKEISNLGYEFYNLREEDAAVVNDNWTFKSETSFERIKYMINNFICCGIRTKSCYDSHVKELVSWCLTSHDGSISMLCTIPSHRRKGLARYAVMELLSKYKNACNSRTNHHTISTSFPFAYILVDNQFSISIFKSLGFRKINDTSFCLSCLINMSDGPFLCYRELLPSSSIEAASFFRISNHNDLSSDLYLFVASSNSISIYSVVSLESSEANYELRLSLFYTIHGKIRDVSTYYALDEGCESDYIVVLIDIGKILVLQYNPLVNTLETVFLRNIEERSIGAGSNLHLTSHGHHHPLGAGFESIVRIDESQRIMCSTHYGCQLFFCVLPKLDTPAQDSKTPHFIIDLDSALKLNGPIIDIGFVYGYSKPCLAVLQEVGIVPIGHVGKIRNTCQISVLGIDLDQNSVFLLWQQKSLPHDSSRIVELKHTSCKGCVGLVSMNAFLIVEQSFVSGIACNGFAAVTVAPQISILPWQIDATGAELNGSYWIEESQYDQSRDALVGVLQNGDIMRILITKPIVPAVLTPFEFTFEIIGLTLTHPSCFCTEKQTLSDDQTGSQIWFIGSKLSDALLFSVQCTVNDKLELKKTLVPTDVESPHVRLLPAVEEEILLYGDKLADDLIVTEDGNNNEWVIKVCDCIPVTGPILDGLFTKTDDLFHLHNSLNWDRSSKKPSTLSGITMQTAASYIADREMKDGLQICCGLDDQGSLTRVYSGLQFTKLASRFTQGAAAIFSLTDLYGGLYSIIFIAYESKTRFLHAYEQIKDEVEVLDSVKKLSTANNVELKFKEINGSESGFIFDETTICVGIVQSPDEKETDNSHRLPVDYYAIQVVSQGIRLISLPHIYGEEAVPLQDTILKDARDVGGLGGMDEEKIIGGEVIKDWVVVITNLNVVYVLQFDSKDTSLNLLKSIQAEHNPMNYFEAMHNDPTIFGNVIHSPITAVSFYHGVLHIHPKNQQMAQKSMKKNDTKYAHLGIETEMEDVLLYGQPLDELNMSDQSNFQVKHEDNSKPGLISQENTNELDAIHQTFLVLAQLSGAITILKLPDLHCVMQISLTNEVIQLKSYPTTNGLELYFSESDVMDIEKPPPEHELNGIDIPNSEIIAGMNKEDCFVQNLKSDKIIIELKMIRLHSKVRKNAHSNVPTNASGSKLCLLVLYHTGDMDLCAAYERFDRRYPSGVGPVSSFYRISSTTINNKKAKSGKGAKHSTHRSTLPVSPTAGENANPNQDVGSEYHEIIQYLASNEYLLKAGQCLTSVMNVNESNGILISCHAPLLLTSVMGLPQLVSIAFPEIPCINYGHQAVIPFRSTNIVSGLITLWREVEDIDSLKYNPKSHALNLSHQKQSLIGIYQELPGLAILPGGSVSLKRLEVKKTVHHFEELNRNKTDDKTEKALLEKKTFVLSCSNDVATPFIPNVLTDEEVALEDILYERYFTNLESFAQPDINVGPIPFLHDRMHQLVIMQGNEAIDIYPFPPYERIVDIQAAYFNVDKQIGPLGAHFSISSGGALISSTTEKRLFIVVCTTMGEKRGEDTQGRGRLLLFCLDYAMYDEEDVIGGDSAASNTADISDPQTQSIERLEMKIENLNQNGIKTGSDPPSNDGLSVKPATLGLPGNPTQVTAQAKFLGSIRPKLRLLWSGSGPASFVKALGEQFVITTVGSTLYVYKFNSTTMELEQVSFYFTQFYIASVSIVKNYVLIADIHHGSTLLLWREQDCSLNFIGKDYNRSVYLTSAFIYDGSKLGMILGDDEGNIVLLQENPKKIESVNGTRLLCLTDFNVGSELTMMITHDTLSTELLKKPPPRDPMDLRPPPPPPRSRKGSSFPLQAFSTRFNKTSNQNKRNCCVVGTMDGSLGVFIPVEEKMYRRLAMLQQLMIFTVPSLLLLNPREYRTCKSSRFRLSKKKGILDGNVLWMYLTLNSSKQDQLADALGVTAYLIKENLREIEIFSSFF